MTSVNSLPGAVWRKSSYSGTNGGNCLEVASGVPGVVPIRDSKVPTGPALMLTPAAWGEFVAFAARHEG
jgi:hypothetical protein